MTKLVASDFNLNKIFDIFLSTVYEKHSSLIDSYKDLNVTVEEVVKKLTKIDFEMHDEFIYQVYEYININDFFKSGNNFFSAEENLINDKNYELLHVKALQIRDNFEAEVIDLDFSTNGQKLVFQDYFNYFVDRLEGGG